LIGCSGKSDLSYEESCNKKFEEAHEKFVKKKYSIVREPFSDLLSTCSGQGFIEQALFELAESHFYLEEWMEAQTEYENLVRDFPVSQYSEKAWFRIAECSMNQIYMVDRDQSKTREAIENFKAFININPTSSQVDSAKKQIDLLHKQIAKKDIRIANLYLKMGEPLAAAIYYKSVLKEFPNQVDRKQVHLNLTKCYLALNQLEQAENFLKDFQGLDPQDEIYSKVQKLNQQLEKKKAENSNTNKKPGK
jgi:outer membrane protein assembly factor BamD